MTTAKRFFDAYVTDQDLAAELGCHKRTVRRWAEQGLLAYVLLGRQFLIHRKKSQRALDARASKNKRVGGHVIGA
jgi:excisionase family DNA binding protein